MTEIFPNYYGEFQCIADRCDHNCCIGWEIDIDPDTLAFYEGLGSAGKFITDAVLYGETPCFKQDERGRCALLDERGLCKIITSFGEEALCDICRDHPRFRNFLPDRTETGLGLCCPEAARIILGQREEFTVPYPDDDNFAALRQKVFSVLQDESVPLDDAVGAALDIVGGREIEADYNMLYVFFASLERLDKRWDGYLSLLTRNAEEFSGFDRAFRRLLCYFVFRHISPDNITYGVCFAALSYRVIRRIFAACDSRDFETLCDIARAYSAEIEYSDENLDAVFSLFEFE